MNDLLRFALLGLGTGGIYALLGLGLVVIYRGSGVINFAQSGFALVGAYLTYRFQVVDGHGTFVSWGAAIVCCAVLGVAVHWLVMRPLRTASPLARVIATLGVLTVLTQAVVLKFGAKQVIADVAGPDRRGHTCPATSSWAATASTSSRSRRWWPCCSP